HRFSWAFTVRSNCPTSKVRYLQVITPGATTERNDSLDALTRRCLSKDVINTAQRHTASRRIVAKPTCLNWDAKYTYLMWWPVTAIRNGDRDGNDATERDAAWTSFNSSVEL